MTSMINVTDEINDREMLIDGLTKKRDTMLIG